VTVRETRRSSNQHDVAIAEGARGEYPTPHDALRPDTSLQDGPEKGRKYQPGEELPKEIFLVVKEESRACVTRGGLQPGPVRSRQQPSSPQSAVFHARLAVWQTSAYTRLQQANMLTLISYMIDVSRGEARQRICRFDPCTVADSSPRIPTATC
jgi:hypothetical protein